MRIVFIGCVEFSLQALKKVVSLNGNVVGVCTLKESAFNSDFVDLSYYSIEQEIPYNYVNNINSINSIEWISKLNPDIIFCFGWSRLLSDEILKVAPLGVIGFHPGEIPTNRGRHPIIWALALGLKQTATSFFFMDKGADSGDILSQEIISITDDDDARSLYNKVVSTAMDQIEWFLPKLMINDYPKVKQDHLKSNTWRKRSREDGVIDWRMSANSIHNLVRALSKPYAGAEFQFKKVIYKVWKTEIVMGNFDNIEPGKVLDTNDELLCPIVKCGDNALKLIKVEPRFCVEKGIYL